MSSKKIKSKSKSRSKSKSKSKSKSRSRINVNQPIGIYDPDGLNINPLTNQPYKNLYSHLVKTINGQELPATYTNLAKIWKTKLVYLHKDQILYSIQNNQITLAKAGTGVGKTVLIPKIALHAFNYKKNVITTIPKKVITRSTAEFAAQCLDVKIGEEVGYYFKGENKTSDKTKLCFTTTGSLISKITGSDPYLKDYDCVIIDEAHERTVQTDQLLLLLKKALEHRKDLKIVIMSATINLEVFRNYFPSNKFKFNEVDAGEHTSYEIQDYWLDKRPKPNEWKELAVKRIINILSNSTFGDILVFIRASSDGKSICENLNNTIKKNRLSIKPFCTILAGNSSKEDEELATDEYKYKDLKTKSGKFHTRKVVMATNVAESSLTVDGVVYVIDCGLEYEDSYEPSKMSRMLTEEFIAKSSMKQRRGRGGRTRPGICYHLYTEEDSKKFKDYPTPSIQKTDLTNDILDLMKLKYINNIKDLKQFLNEFLSPPSDKFINSALHNLYSMEAITSKDNNGKLTDLGRIFTKFRAVKLHHCKILLSSYYYKCQKEICDIISLLIVSDGMLNSIFYEFRENPKSKHYKKRKQDYNTSQTLFHHSYGDIFTLYNILVKMKEQEELIKDSIQKKISKKEINIYLSNRSRRPKISKGMTKKSINKNTSLKHKKALSLLKRLQVSEPKIQSVKKTSIEDDTTKVKINKKQELIKLTKKWCVDNFINYNKLVKSQMLSKKLFHTLKKIMVFRKDHKIKNITVSLEQEDIENIKTHTIQKGSSLKKINKYFDYDIDYTQKQDDTILLCLLEGMFINIASKQHSSMYKTCFPLVKTKAKINPNSVLKNNTRFIFYDELFMFNRNSDVLKLNLVNMIPKYLEKQITEKFNTHLKTCLGASSFKHSLKKMNFKFYKKKTKKKNKKRRK